jgi:hypothetical protein
MPTPSQSGVATAVVPSAAQNISIVSVLLKTAFQLTPHTPVAHALCKTTFTALHNKSTGTHLSHVWMELEACRPPAAHANSHTNSTPYIAC